MRRGERVRWYLMGMTPDVPATWLYHCHVNDHILTGMQARFLIQAPQGTAGS
jgi:FtsP/CotA-like multicopper oxidase with cupredoxin domain